MHALVWDVKRLHQRTDFSSNCMDGWALDTPVYPYSQYFPGKQQEGNLVAQRPEMELPLQSTASPWIC